jgi:hypothetical protein
VVLQVQLLAQDFLSSQSHLGPFGLSGVIGASQTDISRIHGTLRLPKLAASSFSVSVVFDDFEEPVKSQK